MAVKWTSHFQPCPVVCHEPSTQNWNNGRLDSNIQFIHIYPTNPAWGPYHQRDFLDSEQRSTASFKNGKKKKKKTMNILYIMRNPTEFTTRICQKCQTKTNPKTWLGHPKFMSSDWTKTVESVDIRHCKATPTRDQVTMSSRHGPSRRIKRGVDVFATYRSSWRWENLWKLGCVETGMSHVRFLQGWWIFLGMKSSTIPNWRSPMFVGHVLFSSQQLQEKTIQINFLESPNKMRMPGSVVSYHSILKYLYTVM